MKEYGRLLSSMPQNLRVVHKLDQPLDLSTAVDENSGLEGSHAALHQLLTSLVRFRQILVFPVEIPLACRERVENQEIIRLRRYLRAPH